MAEIKYSLGCAPSQLDGTEKVFNNKSMEIPKEYSYVSVMPPIRDQGQTSECVCYSVTAYLDWKKNLAENDNNGCQFNVDELYDIRSNKPSEGMQIKEALAYLKHTGLGKNQFKINNYYLVGSVEMLKRALILNGPCPCGMMVKSFDSDFWNGYNQYGGHCTLIVGYNEYGFIIRNSWGKNWAKDGYTLIPYEDFNKIFEIWTMD